MQVMLEPAILQQQQQIYITYSNILKNRKGLKLFKKRRKRKWIILDSTLQRPFLIEPEVIKRKQDILEATLLKRPVVISLRIQILS